MREDFEEMLERMFPEGYAALYACEDGTLRVNVFNPKQWAAFAEYLEDLVDIREARQGRPGKVLYAQILHTLNNTELKDIEKLSRIRRLILCGGGDE